MAQKALLIGRKELVRYTPLSGNIDTDKIIQYIEIAQDIHLQELLGTDLLEKLQADIIASSLSGRYAEVAELCKPVLSHYSFMEFLPFAQYIIGNKGLFKHTSENATEASSNEVVAMKEKSRDTAQFYAKRLIDYLCAHSNELPEYLSNTDEDVNPRRSRPFGGWQI
jgi:hypothetical protein